MQTVNEICYLVVSVLYFCFTDFNKDPLIKLYCGWVLILVVIANLIWPNLTVMLRGIWPEVKAYFSSKGDILSLLKRKGGMSFMKKGRGRLTKSYGKKLNKM